MNWEQRKDRTISAQVAYNALALLQNLFKIWDNVIVDSYFTLTDEHRAFLERSSNEVENCWLSYLSYIKERTTVADCSILQIYYARGWKDFVRYLWYNLTKDIWPLDSDKHPDWSSMKREDIRWLFHELSMILEMTYVWYATRHANVARTWTWDTLWKNNKLNYRYLIDDGVFYGKFSSKKQKSWENIFFKDWFFSKSDDLQIIHFDWKVIQDVILEYMSFFDWDLSILGKYLDLKQSYNYKKTTKVMSELYDYAMSPKRAGTQDWNLEIYRILWQRTYIDDAHDDRMKEIYATLVQHTDYVKTYKSEDIFGFLLALDILEHYDLLYRQYAIWYDNNKIESKASNNKIFNGMKFFNKGYFDLMKLLRADVDWIKSLIPVSTMSDAMYQNIFLDKLKYEVQIADINHIVLPMNPFVLKVTEKDVPVEVRDTGYTAVYTSEKGKMNVSVIAFDEGKPSWLKKSNIDTTDEAHKSISTKDVLKQKNQPTKKPTSKKKVENNNMAYVPDNIVTEAEQREQVAIPEPRQTTPKAQQRSVPKKRIHFTEIYDKLREKVKGQDEILYVVSQKIHSYIFLKNNNNTPLSLFFMWPPGTWKTYLATVLKDVLNELLGDDYPQFNAQEEAINNYTSKESLSKLLGSSKWLIGSKDPIAMFEELKKSPNQIVLFDEVEKGPKEFFDFMLNFMNNGTMTTMNDMYSTYMGKWTSFSLKWEQKIHLDNCILIFTSNILHTHEDMYNLMNVPADKRVLIDRDVEPYSQTYSQYNRLYSKALECGKISPPFVSRLHGSFMFNPLTRDAIESITMNKFEEMICDYAISDESQKKIRDRFKTEMFTDWGVDRLMQFEWVRTLKTYIGDWISSYIQLEWLE